MSDKELVDYAGKALGWVDYPDDSLEHGSVWHLDKERAPFGRITEKSSWNPLVSDGDCARLEAALEINFQWKQDRCVMSFGKGWVMAERYCDHNSDKQKARRYASVKVAAAIGRALSK